MTDKLIVYDVRGVLRVWDCDSRSYLPRSDLRAKALCKEAEAARAPRSGPVEEITL